MKCDADLLERMEKDLRLAGKAELADVGEGLRMPRPHQGLAAFGLEKVDLLRVNGNALPVLQVQQDAVFEDGHESSVGLPVDSAVKRGLGRLNGRFGG
jgi:hypothetical protein